MQDCPARSTPLTLLEPQGRGKPTWSISGQKLSVVSDAELPERTGNRGWWWFILLVIFPLPHICIFNTLLHLFSREGSLSSSLHTFSRPSLSSLVVAYWKCSCFAMLWKPERETFQGFSWKPPHISFSQASDLWPQNYLSSRTAKSSTAHTSLMPFLSAH